MPETGDEALDAITRRQNLAIDSTVAWFERELRAVVSKAQLRTLAELTKRLKIEDGRIAATAANQRVLRSIEEVFAAAMRRAGYGELIEELAGSFGNQFSFFDDVLTQLGVSPVKFAKPDLEYFAAQQESVVATLQGIVQNVAGLAMRKALLSAGGLDPADLAEIIARETGKSIAQSTTIADTAQSSFYRTIADQGFQRIEASQPKQHPLRYFYYGPDDKLNRVFCHELLDRQKAGLPKGQADVLAAENDPVVATLGQRSFTRDEIDAMDNGQLPNVFLTGGGYRCRHQWIIDRRVLPRRAGEPLAVKITASSRVGRVDRGIAKAFAPRNPEYTVVLTQERLDHFAAARGRGEAFGTRQVIQAVLDPEFVYRDPKNSDTGLFYRRLDDQHLLAVAVKFAERKGAKKHSIITAHPVRDRSFRRLPRRNQVWQRPESE